MDPNRNMRHTVYNDYAVQIRVALLSDYGFDLNKLEELQLGRLFCLVKKLNFLAKYVWEILLK